MNEPDEANRVPHGGQVERKASHCEGNSPSPQMRALPTWWVIGANSVGEVAEGEMFALVRKLERPSMMHENQGAGG